jgi:mono/diheme cytochrome c family protein
MKNHFNIIAALLLSAVFLFAFTFADQGNPWKVPDKYEKMENPHDADKESLKIGKRLWKKHCASCHGSDGLGDGSKAANLETSAGDFSSEGFQAQSDGAIFYKSWFGRDEMPNYEKKIRYEEDVWHLVNYMRTMGE